MILVTGGTGNVGAELVHQLLEKGQTVRVLTRDARKWESLAGRVASKGRVPSARLDSDSISTTEVILSTKPQ